MQQSFAFAARDLDAWRARLGPIAVPRRRRPIGQLVKSLISARTRDAVSLAAYRRLGKCYGSAAALARAEPPAVERLPGVARKVAASTLNASTLGRPVMIVDTHVLRVLARLGFVAAAADYRAASEAVTAAMPGWSGDDFLGFHIALKRLGQAVCRWDVPDCGACPLAAECPVGGADAECHGANDWRMRAAVR